MSYQRYYSRKGSGRRVPQIQRGYPFEMDVPGATRITLAADGYPARTFDVPLSLNRSETEGIPPGEVRWSAENADGEFVSDGRFESVRTPKADGDKPRPKTFAEKALAEVEKVLEEASGDATLSISVAGKSLSFNTHQDLLMYRGKLRIQVEQERGISRNVRIDRDKYRIGHGYELWPNLNA